MQQLVHKMRRITPFIFPFLFLLWLSSVNLVWAAEPTGRWLFIDDGSSIEISPCQAPEQGLCGKLVQLPKTDPSITPVQRKQLCGLTILGELKISKAKPEEQIRLEGWVIDPEDLSKTDNPKRYPASFVVMTPVSAKLDVHGPFNIVLQSHRLIRPALQAKACDS
jgi:hypothetical protein